MAEQGGKINVLKVMNHVPSSEFDCEILKEILNDKFIKSKVEEYEDGWLITVDCESYDVLAKNGFELSGKFGSRPYYLEFTHHQVHSPEEQYTGKAESKILVKNLPPDTTEQELKTFFEDDVPFGGEVVYTHIESTEATIAFLKVEVASKVISKAPLKFKENWINIHGSEVPENQDGNEVPENQDGSEVPENQDGSEVPKNQVETKNISVHNVSEDMNTTKEKITKLVAEKSPTSCTLKQPLKPDDLAGEKIEKLPTQSDPTTIVVHDVPKHISQMNVKLYFQNNKKSRGGEITELEPMMGNQKNQFKITFASSIVAKNVVEKKDHMVEKNPLTVSMYIPPMMDEKQVLFSDIKPEISDEALENLLGGINLDVENVKQMKPGSWLVYFSDKIDFEKLKKEICEPEYAEFLSQTCPKVSQVPITNKIIVSNIPPETTLDSLKNSFYNFREPDEFVSIKMLPGRKCIVTFKDANVASLYSQSTHTGFDINLYNDFMESETYVFIPLPSPFWIEFLKEQEKVFEDKLKDYGIPVWSESTEELLKIRCNGDIEEEEIKTRIQAWLENGQKVDILSHIFEEVKKEASNVKKNIHVYFDKENLAAHILSFDKSAALDCYKEMVDIVDTKLSVREEIEFEDHKISLLFADLFQRQTIRPHYDKVKITTEGAKLVIEGSPANVKTITDEIYKFICKISFSRVQFSNNVHHILQKKPVKEYLLKKLMVEKCSFAWEINPENEVFIHSSQKTKLQSAIDISKKCFVNLDFKLTEQMKKTMNGEKWDQFMKKMSDQYADKFHMENDNNKLSIVTIDSISSLIGDDFGKYFETNVTYMNTFPLKYGVYHFLKRFSMGDINSFKQTNKSTICIKENQTVLITGLGNDNKEASEFLNSLINTIKRREEIYSHVGFQKFMQTDAADTMLDKISESNKCIILKSEDMNSDNILGGQVKYANSDIILQLIDITELDVDVIVNAANCQLKCMGGLFGVIVKKGGQEILNECKQVMEGISSGKLPEGSIEVTTAGKLKCKMIIHAVGPMWRDGTHEIKSLSGAVSKALNKANNSNYNSIAFPAISTGLFRFPLEKATEVIVSSIKKYLENNPQTSLKSIYLASINDDVVTAFHQQMKLIFGEVTALPKKSDDFLPDGYGQVEQLQRGTSTSQTNIEIILGLLNNIQCDVIVNTTNNSMNLSVGAISKAILSVAGKGLQDECSNLPPLKRHDIAVTDGYNLPCSKVFHISIPHWSLSSQEVIKVHMRKCLQKADEMKFSHIAFPALGTGQLGYPISTVANVMFSTASEYISDTKTVLKKISFVIYPKDQNIYQEFEKAKKRGPTISDARTNQPGISSDAQTNQSGISSDAQTDQSGISSVTAMPNVSPQGDSVDINGITLTVQRGNIAELKVDGIVHGTNQQFSLNGAITKALQSKIGQQFTNDCKSKVDEMRSAGYAITSGHSLDAAHIVHVNVERIKKNASQIFKLCFEAAEKHQMKSLALPPLGTGGLGCTVQYFMKNFLSALNEFAKSAPQHLKTVNLVIFTAEMVTEVYRELGSQEKSQQSVFSKFTSKSISSIRKKSSFAGAFSKGKEEVIESNRKTVSLFFYAKSLEAIDKAKKEIDLKYTSKYCIEKDVSDTTIEFSPEQEQSIRRLQNKYEVNIEFKCSKIKLSGYKEDVDTVYTSILELIMEFKNCKDAEMTQKLVQWSYTTNKNGETTLVPYDKEINHQLEFAYQNNIKNQKVLKMPHDSRSVVYDWSDPNEMCEYLENEKKNSIKIYRKDKAKGVSLPEHWAPMDGIAYLAVEVTAGSEYDKVKNLFPTNFSISKMERIQNKSLYIQYQAELVKMDETNPKGTKNETQGLWHGTSDNVTDSISKMGFNRSYCGKNAVAFGKGVYFAVNANYSLSNTYTPPDSAGNKYIYMCNVLTGIFCQGNSGTNVPPNNPALSGIPFDSTTNDITNPSMFVTFHDARAYPVYLITCK